MTGTESSTSTPPYSSVELQDAVGRWCGHYDRGNKLGWLRGLHSGLPCPRPSGVASRRAKIASCDFREPPRAPRGWSPVSTYSLHLKKPALGGFFKWGDAASLKPVNFPQPQVPKIVPFSISDTYKNPAFLHQKYVAERLSTKEISRLIFSSRSTVSKYLKKYGIPIRPQDQHHRTRSQLRFGEAWRNRKVVAHRKELATLRKIQKLRQNGMSFWKIADVLNALGTRTKTRRGKWHARYVQKVLNSAPEPEA